MDNLCVLYNNTLSVRNIFWDCDKKIAFEIRFAFQQATIKSLFCWCWWKFMSLKYCCALLASGLQISFFYDRYAFVWKNFIFVWKNKTFGCFNNVEPFPVIIPAPEFIHH